MTSLLSGLMICAALAGRPGTPDDQPAVTAGRLLRISPERTTILVELMGHGVVAGGDRLAVETEDGETIAGDVVRVLTDGRALVRLDQSFPRRSASGDTVGARVVSPLTTERCRLGTQGVAGSTLLRPGGNAKPYWHPASNVTLYRQEDVPGDAQYSLAVGRGEHQVVGGALDEDSTYAAETLTHAVHLNGGSAVKLPWSDSDSIKGGLAASREATSLTTKALITNELRGTSDLETHERASESWEVAPHVTWLQRPATFDLGWAGGLSWRFAGLEREIATRSGERDAETSSLGSRGGGPHLEIGPVAYGWAMQMQVGFLQRTGDAAQLGLSPYLGEYGLVVETYAAAVKARLETTILQTGDEMTAGAPSGFHIGGRVSFGRDRWHVVPYADYEMLRERGAIGRPTRRELEIGTRVALAGTRAPFALLGGQVSREETDGNDTRPATKTTLRTVRAGIGMSL